MHNNFRIENAPRKNFSGNFLEITQSRWGYLKNLKIYGKSTGGEGTPAAPVPINSVASGFNLVSCGKNRFNPSYLNDNVFNYVTLSINNGIVRETANAATGYMFASDINRYLLTGGTTYTLSFKVKCSKTINTPATGVAGFYKNTNTPVKVIFINWTTTDERIFTIEYTPADTALYNIMFYGYNQNGSAINLATGDYIEFWDITLNQGRDISYTKFTGKSVNINFEDTAGTIYSLNSLPDGTKDEYHFDNDLLIKKIKKIEITCSDGWSYENFNETFAKISYFDPANKWDLAENDIQNVRCTIANTLSNNAGEGIITTNHTADGTNICIYVLKSGLISLNDEGARAWISSHLPFILMYEYATAQKIYLKRNNNICQFETDYNYIYTNALLQPYISADAISI